MILQEGLERQSMYVYQEAYTDVHGNRDKQRFEELELTTDMEWKGGGGGWIVDYRQRNSSLRDDRRGRNWRQQTLSRNST